MDYLNVGTGVTKVTVVTILIVVVVATVVTVGDNFKCSDIIDNGYSNGISDISENMEIIQTVFWLTNSLTIKIFLLYFFQTLLSLNR